MGAGSKGEPEQKPSRPAPITSAPAPAIGSGAEAAKSPADTAVGGSEYAPGEALKERLARQAAAEKLFNAATPEPARPRAPEAKAPPAPAKAPEPAKGAAPLAPPKPATRLIRRVGPVFPREAVNAGVYEGTVASRLTLDGSGNVTRVEAMEAWPRRPIDRAVIRALSDWKYNDGAPSRTVEVEVAFKAQ